MKKREKARMIRVLRLTLAKLYDQSLLPGITSEKKHYLAGQYQAYKEMLEILEGKVVILQPTKE
jgi:hypothetical protein